MVILTKYGGNKMSITLDKIVGSYIKFTDKWNAYINTKSKTKKAIASAAMLAYMAGVPLLGYAVDKYLLNGNGDKGMLYAMSGSAGLIITLSAIGRARKESRRIEELK